MPNQLPPFLEERIVAFALGQPGRRPRRIAALRRAAWGGMVVSGSGVFTVLARHGISTRRKRLSLVAGYAAPPEPQRPVPSEPAHLVAPHPGSLVSWTAFTSADSPAPSAGSGCTP